MSNLLIKLRALTHDAHQRLHVHPVLSRLTAQDIQQEEYQYIISRFFGFYAPLETAYALSQHSELRDYPTGQSIKRLQADLVHQNIDAQSLPLESSDTIPFSLEHALGYLYLREGSALGGQVISKHLEKNLGLRPGEQNTFFYGSGKNTGMSWKAFITTLQTLEKNLDIDRTAQYSAELFARLENWMHRKNNNDQRAEIAATSNSAL